MCCLSLPWQPCLQLLCRWCLPTCCWYLIPCSADVEASGNVIRAT